MTQPPASRHNPALSAQLAARVRANQVKLAAIKARGDLIRYMQFMKPDPDHHDDPSKSLYEVKAHHQALADALMEVESGKFVARGKWILCVSMPPQRGKSELTSRGFPAWFIGRNPHKQFILGAYSDDFSRKFGEDVRVQMESERYRLVFPKAGLRTGSRAKDFMVTERGGRLSFVGRGGGGTGLPSDLFMIDDPTKNAEEAHSLTTRDSIWDWFNNVVVRRGHAYSVIVIVATRWAEDDLIGRLTDPTNHYYNTKVAEKVVNINLPAIVDDAELAQALGVPLGGSLWEERFPLKMLEIRRELDPAGFSALEMGRPTPPEGNFFKRAGFKTYGSPAHLPADIRWYGAADLAVSPQRDANSSVIANFGLDPAGDIWVHWDLFWEKKAADESVDQLIAYCKQFNWFEFFGEKGQISNAIGPFLTKRAAEEGATALTVPMLFPTTGDKGRRASSIRGRMTQGRVNFPSFAPWWPRALDCCLKFTGTGDDKEDDMPDCLGIAGQGLDRYMKAQVPAKAESNVVPFTIGWVKQQHAREQEMAKRRAGLRGM